MSLYEILTLAVVAATAGAINAVAGGGTLLTFPTLLFFHTPAVVANATSTIALMFGMSGSVYGYRRHLRTVKPWLWRLAPVSIVGGLLGGILLTHTTEKTFGKLVPFLILFATILFLAQGMVRRLLGLEDRSGHDGVRPAPVGAMIFQFAVSVYGGYFGAGIGILMLAAMSFLGLKDIHEMNTLKTILGFLINVVAAVWFVGAGLIAWPKVAVMTSGALVGYYLGSHYSQRISQKQVRHIITTVGFVLSGVTFYEQFVR